MAVTRTMEPNALGVEEWGMEMGKKNNGLKLKVKADSRKRCTPVIHTIQSYYENTDPLTVGHTRLCLDTVLAVPQGPATSNNSLIKAKFHAISLIV